jgi:hypothetical protein
MTPPPPQPPAWQGWRRPRGSEAPWQPVPAARAAGRGDCYTLLMHAGELTAGEPGDWEYAILPEGERPRATRQQQTQTYRTRMLRAGP